MSETDLVVLRGGLSNHPNSLQDLLQCLIGPESDQGRRRRPRKRSGWPDGRRRFGTVSGAVLKVLERNGGEMSTKAIREEVEALLGGNVSRFTVSDFLLARSKGAKPLFEGLATGTTGCDRYGHNGLGLQVLLPNRVHSFQFQPKAFVLFHALNITNGDDIHEACSRTRLLSHLLAPI